MTKQEEIKKMATTMCGYYNDGKCVLRCCCEPCDKFNSQDCSYKEDAEALYNAGYRKADEVRKETAKEILDKLNALMEQYHYKSTAWRNCANFIKETYGLED